MIPFLNVRDDFPPPDKALTEPNGLLCAGGELSTSSLLRAYRQGIFPWYSLNEPILWWSPNPRMVLFTDEFKLSRSMRKTLASKNYEVRVNTSFSAVIKSCAQTLREGQSGTWITKDVARAYESLFHAGFAYCFETWMNNKLVGGLYGVAIGKMFYGESMFSHVDNASKIAFAHLIFAFKKAGVAMIDCQVYTPHLASMGAREIPRADFLAHIKQASQEETILKNWQAGILRWEDLA